MNADIARAVSSASSPSNAFANGVGRQLVQAHCGFAYPTIKARDVLDVDFDAKNIHEGVYLVQMDIGRGERWFGALRFQQFPYGLRFATVTGDGPSDYMPLTPEIRSSLKIVGRVEGIYKPTVF